MTIRRIAAQLALLALVALYPAAAQEAAKKDPGMTLAEVLEKHYEAVGGTEAWAGVEAVRFNGNMTVGPGMEAPFSMTMKRPDKVRMEFTMQGMTGIQAWDGETAWMVMPFMGRDDPEEMPAEMAEQLEEQADIEGPLFDWKAKGHEVELLGKEQMEGTDVYKVKVTRKSGTESLHYLDSEYFMTIKQAGKRKMQGQEIEFETAISDYKQLCAATSKPVDDKAPCEGPVLVVPHSIQSKAKGAPEGAGQVITITSVDFNPDDIDEAIFSMPEKEEAAAQASG